jgi:glutamate-1-semialdehyde aminotransferase
MEIYRKFRSLLLEGGVLLPPTQLATCYLSYAHTKEDFDKIVFAFSSALERM